MNLTGMKSRWHWLPGAAAVLSIIACYGTFAVVTVLSMLGVALTINKAAWAGAIALFAVSAAALVARNSRRHGARGPIVAAVLGAMLVLWAMFLSYSRVIELAGFAGLIVATIWDWRLMRQRHACETGQPSTMPRP